MPLVYVPIPSQPRRRKEKTQQQPALLCMLMWHSEVPLYDFQPFTRKMTVTVKHDRRRESRSSFCLAVTLEDVQMK